VKKNGPGQKDLIRPKTGPVKKGQRKREIRKKKRGGKFSSGGGKRDRKLTGTEGQSAGNNARPTMEKITTREKDLDKLSQLYGGRDVGGTHVAKEKGRKTIEKEIERVGGVKNKGRHRWN